MTLLEAPLLDAAVEEVAAQASSWAATTALARADLLDQVLLDTLAVQDEWLRASLTAKGLRPGSAEAGEELSAGIGTLVRISPLCRERAATRRPKRSGRCA